MPWVEFERTFTWKPRPNVMRDEPPGLRNVTTACAKAAVAAGAARRVKAPPRGEVPDGGGPTD